MSVLDKNVNHLKISPEKLFLFSSPLAAGVKIAYLKLGVKKIYFLVVHLLVSLPRADQFCVKTNSCSSFRSRETSAATSRTRDATSKSVLGARPTSEMPSSADFPTGPAVLDGLFEEFQTIAISDTELDDILPPSDAEEEAEAASGAGMAMCAYTPPPKHRSILSSLGVDWQELVSLSKRTAESKEVADGGEGVGEAAEAGAEGAVNGQAAGGAVTSLRARFSSHNFLKEVGLSRRFAGEQLWKHITGAEEDVKAEKDEEKEESAAVTTSTVHLAFEDELALMHVRQIRLQQLRGRLFNDLRCSRALSARVDLSLRRFLCGM